MKNLYEKYLLLLKNFRLGMEYIRKQGRYITLFLSVFMLLYTVPVSAQTIDVESAYNEQNYVCESFSEGCGETGSNFQTTGNSFVSTATVVAAALGGTAGWSNEAQARLKYPEVSDMTRLGLAGVIQQTNMAMIYERPQVDVFAHLSEEWVPGYEDGSTSVYAQDGYTFLQSLNISDLWNRVRTIAYAMFVIVLIAAGFFIMFRHKIGGQLVVTIFNTIPEVIIGLVLVTFSFAIVGIAMDFGALLIRIITGIFGGGDMVAVTGPFTLFGDLLKGGWGSGAAGWAGGVGAGTAVAGGLTAGAAGIIGTILSPALLLVGVVGILIMLAVLFIIIGASIKVFVTLLKAYLMLLADTVLAPLYIAISVFPGKKTVRQDWFYRVLKNVLTFVLVFFFVNLGYYLRNSGIDWTLPSALSSGNLGAPDTGGEFLAMIIGNLIPLFFFYVAAESPKFLEDFLPQTGGKGAAAAFGGVSKSFSKIPVLGGMLG